MAMLKPLSRSARGARVPSFRYNPTVAVTDEQHFSFTLPNGTGLIVFNPHCTSGHTVIFKEAEHFINDVGTGSNITDEDETGSHFVYVADTVNTVSGAGDVNTTDRIYADSITDLHGKARMVAAGVQLLKTSKADAESGTI